MNGYTFQCLSVSKVDKNLYESSTKIKKKNIGQKGFKICFPYKKWNLGMKWRGRCSLVVVIDWKIVLFNSELFREHLHHSLLIWHWRFWECTPRHTMYSIHPSDYAKGKALISWMRENFSTALLVVCLASAWRQKLPTSTQCCTQSRVLETQLKL